MPGNYNAIGGYGYHYLQALLDEVERRFQNLEELTQFLKTITRPEARELIVGEVNATLRGWCGYFLRSTITAGIWKMYIIAVSEMIVVTAMITTVIEMSGESPRPRAKYRCRT